MKLENWSQSQDKVVKDFCVTQKEAFRDWCTRDAEYFTRGGTVLLGIVLYASLAIWNYSKAQDLRAAGVYALPMLILALVALFPSQAARNPLLVVDLVFSLTVCGSVYLLEVAFQKGLASSNIPLQMALLVAVAVSFRSTEAGNYLRALFYLVLAISAVALFDFTHIKLYAIQLILGPVCGLWFANESLKTRRHQFYAVTTNTRMRLHSYNELVKLVPPHVVTHIQLGHALETTMPCGPGTACIISFDIVKSSQIEHPEFFKSANAMKNRCYQLLKEGYNAEGTESNGYRIKDTGDGFLCSIGYPYRPPTDRSMVDVAHDLAESFAAIFDEEMANLRLPTPPRCSMGIAIGEIRGFFPDEEPRQYDLHGRVIMLATRYEAMRNKLLDHPAAGLSGNIIFIAEKVWLGLPDAKRSFYELWECNSPDRKVRDDPSAKRAYFRILNNG